MDTPALATILNALAAACERTAVRSVARAVGITPSHVLNLVAAAREGREPRVWPPTQQKLVAWYLRCEAGDQPEVPRLPVRTRRILLSVAERLDATLNPDLTLLVGAYRVTMHDVVAALSRLGQD
jgi:hypothetical protein